MNPEQIAREAADEHLSHAAPAPAEQLDHLCMCGHRLKEHQRFSDHDECIVGECDCDEFRPVSRSAPQKEMESDEIIEIDEHGKVHPEGALDWMQQQKEATFVEQQDYQKQLYEECVAPGWDSYKINTFAGQQSYVVTGGHTVQG